MGTLESVHIFKQSMQTQSELNTELDAAAQLDVKLKQVINSYGYPEPRPREHGFKTMLRIIVSQQISTKVAAVIWARVEQVCEQNVSPQTILSLNEDALKSCGLSWQKVGYTKALAERIDSGALKPQALINMPTQEVLTTLTQIKGYGIWSAEIYAMFALGKADIYPAGDLALQVAVQRLENLTDKPSEKQTREIAKRWSPHQSAVALLMWHYYGATTLS